MVLDHDRQNSYAIRTTWTIAFETYQLRVITVLNCKPWELQVTSWIRLGWISKPVVEKFADKIKGRNTQHITTQQQHTTQHITGRNTQQFTVTSTLIIYYLLITSVKEVMYFPMSVCLSVCLSAWWLKKNLSLRDTNALDKKNKGLCRSQTRYNRFHSIERKLNHYWELTAPLHRITEQKHYTK